MLRTLPTTDRVAEEGAMFCSVVDVIRNRVNASEGRAGLAEVTLYRE